MYNLKKLIESKKFNKKGSLFVGVNVLLVAIIITVVSSTGANTKKDNASVLANNEIEEVAENINHLPFDEYDDNIIEPTEAVAETEAPTETETESLTLATKPNIPTSRGVAKTDTNAGNDNTEAKEKQNEVANDSNEVAPTETVELSISGKSNEEYKQMAINNKASYQALLNEVVGLLNQERANVGVAPLTPEYTLDIMAGHRSAENADCNFFEHGAHHYRPFETSDGSCKVASTICYYYGRYGSFAEVMGRRQTTATAIVNGWHNSAPHYAAIIDPKYTKVGVGLALDSNGDYYWTAILMN